MILDSPSRPDPLTRSAAAHVAAGGVAVLAAGAGIAGSGVFTGGGVAGALAPYLIVGAVVIARVRAFHPHARFGGANVLTLARLVITSLLGGFAVEVAVNGRLPAAGAAWFFCALAVLALVIDGLDGYAARRGGLASAFGARFDMEVDALMILILCVIALALGKAGAWVLVGGALRYAYEAAGAFWSVLRRPLPPSFRRKLISVIQGGALAALLAPAVQPPASVWIAAAALVLLVYSFAFDMAWLARDAARAEAHAGGAP